ncbi:DUF58 domain-containing protein [Actinomadura sp. 3N407]|uniref:DUF58 domain-containing protein n=1 Tax=Actinomadura sp. 3N407 TaxID=3457423 RepID=UPI003FCD6892
MTAHHPSRDELHPARRRRSGKLAHLAPERTLRRLQLQVTRRLDGLLNGEHLGLLPGPGTELAEARLYQPGEDDVRHMDWAVTARTTSPHVRDLIADHELEAWVLVDLTPSMDFGTGTMIKRDLAVAALAAVGFLTVRLGDRAGAYLLHADGMRRWPARTGKAAMYALLQAALDSQSVHDGAPRTGTGRPGTARTAATPHDLAAAVTSLDRGQTRRGLRVVISDFLAPDGGDPTPGLDPADPADRHGRPDWERPLRRLAARHQVLAIEIIDPRELDLPDVGLVEMTDPETGTAHEIVLNRRVREQYAAAAAAQRDRTRDALRRSGAHHLVLRTDRDWITDIARFALRQRRAAGRTVTTAGARP